MTETTVTPARPLTVEEQEVKPGFIGQNVPRKEDQRLVQGEGVFVDDVKRHGMAYVHFVRSPYAHAAITRIDVSKAVELDGVYGTLIGEEVAAMTEPFFQIAPPPGGHVKDYALAVGRVRHVGEPVVAVAAPTRELARDAADLVEVDYEPLEPVLDPERAADPDDAAPPRGRGLERDLDGRVRLRRLRLGARGGRQGRADQAAALRPLLVDAARDQRRGRRVQPRHRAVDDPLEQPVPGLRDHHDGAGAAGRDRQAAASSRRTSAAGSATRSARTSSSSRSACSRGS